MAKEWLLNLLFLEKERERTRQKKYLTEDMVFIVHWEQNIIWNTDVGFREFKCIF